jgi:hypothetical protein
MVQFHFSRFDKQRDALWVFGVGDSFKKAIRGAQNREGHFRFVDPRRKPLAMALTGFAEKHGLNAAAGTQRFFYEAHTLDADAPTFRCQSTAQRNAKLLQPAIFAAGQKRAVRGSSGNAGCGRFGHAARLANRALFTPLLTRNDRIFGLDRSAALGKSIFVLKLPVLLFSTAKLFHSLLQRRTALSVVMPGNAANAS